MNYKKTIPIFFLLLVFTGFAQADYYWRFVSNSNDFTIMLFTTSHIECYGGIPVNSSPNTYTVKSPPGWTAKNQFVCKFATKGRSCLDSRKGKAYLTVKVGNKSCKIELQAERGSYNPWSGGCEPSWKLPSLTACSLNIQQQITHPYTNPVNTLSISE